MKSESKAMAEEESWSGWNQVKELPWNINQTERIRNVESKIEEWEVRQDVANNEAVSERCSSDFDDEGRGAKIQVGGRASLDCCGSDRGFLRNAAQRVRQGRQSNAKETVDDDVIWTFFLLASR